jgi:hypothetical protein
VTGLPLLDFLHDRVKLMKLFWIGFWAGLVFMGIGYAIMLLDLVG